MRKMLVLAMVAIVATAVAENASADAVYQTERLELAAVGGAPGGGMVVNIHPNGPEVYAHEVYTLQHAAPGEYAVFLNIFLEGLDCTGSKFAIPTATIATNAAGNGSGDVKFAPQDVAALRGMTFSISWTVVGPATYRTECTVVTLD